MNLKNFLIILIFAGCMLLFSGGAVYAGDCDGESGAAYGLCTAYCEAMDCDGDNPNADDQACDRVFINYEKITGNLLFPCEQIPLEFCPCYTFFNGAENWGWYDPSDTHCIRETSEAVIVMSDQFHSMHSYNTGSKRCEGRRGVGDDIQVFYSADPVTASLQHEACKAMIRAVAEDQSYGACP